MASLFLNATDPVGRSSCAFWFPSSWFSSLSSFFWPYYHLYRIDDALGRAEPAALAPSPISTPSGQYQAASQWALGLKNVMTGGNPMGWFQQGLQRAGEVALEETINLEWVQSHARCKGHRDHKRPAYFLTAVDFAMFESWNSFLVRLGKLGYNDTHIRLRLEGVTWKITDIVR